MADKLIDTKPKIPSLNLGNLAGEPPEVKSSQSARNNDSKKPDLMQQIKGVEKRSSFAGNLPNNTARQS
jgi:hypothetical protein